LVLAKPANLRKYFLSAAILCHAKNMSDSTVRELFRTQSRRVRNFMRRRLRNSEDAQDATQEVFVGLLRRSREGAFTGDVQSYLARAARNAAIDVERWRSVHGHGDRVLLDEEHVASDAVDAGEALFWKEALHRMVSLLNELPDATQQVFLLYHMEGLPHAVIAARLHMSIRTVERHMARAIAHCEEHLKEYLG
jgi:RNA polymerase sigma-19 factor, ECF subfamily